MAGCPCTLPTFPWPGGYTRPHPFHVLLIISSAVLISSLSSCIELPIFHDFSVWVTVMNFFSMIGSLFVLFSRSSRLLLYVNIGVTFVGCFSTAIIFWVRASDPYDLVLYGARWFFLSISLLAGVGFYEWIRRRNDFDGSPDETTMDYELHVEWNDEFYLKALLWASAFVLAIQLGLNYTFFILCIIFKAIGAAGCLLSILVVFHHGFALCSVIVSTLSFLLVAIYPFIHSHSYVYFIAPLISTVLACSVYVYICGLYYYFKCGGDFRDYTSKEAGLLLPDVGAKGSWKVGLCHCNGSPGGSKVCLLAAFCPCVLFGMTHSKAYVMPESFCNGACTLYFFLQMCCGLSWIYGTTFRGTLRHFYDISGNMVEDLACHCCCTCCALIQEHNETLLSVPLVQGHGHIQQAAQSPITMYTRV